MMSFAAMYNTYLGRVLYNESPNLADTEEMYYLDLLNCLG